MITWFLINAVISALAREFKVDRHTIRRDLEDIEARGRGM